MDPGGQIWNFPDIAMVGCYPIRIWDDQIIISNQILAIAIKQMIVNMLIDGWIQIT